MFFQNEYEPQIIENITFKELEQRVGTTNTPYNLEDLPNRWAWFSYLKGKEAGLNDMYCVNFGYTISSFIAGMGVDAGTDVYFNLTLDDAIFDIYENCVNTANQEQWSEEKLVTEFFHMILLFYKSENGACKYEKAVFGHNIRVSSEIRSWFLSQKQSVKQTIVQLMNKTIESPHLHSTGKEENITFNFTYSEEDMWNKLPEETDTEKIEGLIDGLFS